jgi:transposase
VIQVAAGTKVYLACRPVSMRYGFDGLAAQVAQVLDTGPFSGQVFVFRNKKGDYLKILHWDGPGLCVFSKRLESGKFVWPPIVDGGMILTPGQLALLLEAIDWRRTVAAALPRKPGAV